MKPIQLRTNCSTLNKRSNFLFNYNLIYRRKSLANNMEKMFWFLLFGFLQVGQIIGLRYIEVGNRNRFPIWIETQTNNNGPPLHAIVKLPPGARNKYTISDGGWAGRLWAKVGCDDSGHNCEFGQSVPPCPPGGCHPPAETKVEFFFPQVDSPNDAYYDISLVRLLLRNIPFNNFNTFYF